MGDPVPSRGNGCRAGRHDSGQPVGRDPGWHFPSREGISIHFMAQRIHTLLIDDLDGGEAVGTVRFGLDGAEYEIDLSAAHDDEFRKALQRYLPHDRRVRLAEAVGVRAATAARMRMIALCFATLHSRRPTLCLPEPEGLKAHF
jgi:Lsr2